MGLVTRWGTKTRWSPLPGAGGRGELLSEPRCARALLAGCGFHAPAQARRSSPHRPALWRQTAGQTAGDGTEEMNSPLGLSRITRDFLFCILHNFVSEKRAGCCRYLWKC